METQTITKEINLLEGEDVCGPLLTVWTWPRIFFWWPKYFFVRPQSDKGGGDKQINTFITEAVVFFWKKRERR